VIRWLSTSEIPQLVATSVVAGGMLPKLQACQDALRQGVQRVRILPALEAEMLPAFYQTKIECGTEVMSS
jgi:acetylglutamate kinase